MAYPFNQQTADISLAFNAAYTTGALDTYRAPALLNAINAMLSGANAATHVLLTKGHVHKALR